nr:uncharacterized protein CTRU02_01003 [Colletotrichum truncatum]KAF6800598.1 hypothetical protein CTRU02_01003 [Colletotrichum truncatum]
MMDTTQGLPKAMDPSWYICQHFFVGARPDPTQPIDHSCGFLLADCKADLEASLTGRWFQEDPDIACSAFALDAVPEACQGALGLVRADVLAWGSDALEDSFTAKYLTVDQVSEASWMVGTGSVDTGNVTAYYEASNRTFIIGTVFGYSSDVAEAQRQTPKLSLACLRPERVPQPAATGRATASTTAVSSTATEAGAVITEAPTATTTTASPYTTTVAGPVCISGTASPNRPGGNFTDLCEFSCTYGFCPPTACQCLEYSETAKIAPALTGEDGYPLDGVIDDDYQHLCSFACSHGTCPQAVCTHC